MNTTTSITLRRNRQGRLAPLNLKLPGESFKDARTKAHNVVEPFLSWMSFRTNVAMSVMFDEIVELSTQTRSWHLGLEGQIVTVTIPTTMTTVYRATPELRSPPLDLP